MPQLSASQLHCLKAIGIERWESRGAEPGLAGLGSGIEKLDSDTRLAALTDQTWQELQDSVSVCTRCALHASRKKAVFGTGDINARWMFVGEAPGAEEDRQGLPFVGRAGQLLNAMLRSIGLARDEVYIANVLKCRPPNNRDPQGNEVKECEPYLHQQISRIDPQIIVALGRFAAQSLLKTTRPINKLRGETFSYNRIPLIVTYHPAYLLRNALDKRSAWEDLCRARALVNE